MYYDGANWQWEDEMGKKLIDKEFAKQILSDLDRIRETLCEIRGTDKVEKKEQRKLWEILGENAGKGSKGEAKAAIAAVIECYEEWLDYRHKQGALPIKPFPEYLKEKML
jgi:hypothetical protein